MISWIQRTFQQHFKWLFLSLLVVVIISFVFVTNTSSGLGQAGERRLPPRPFFGIDLSKAEDTRRLAQDAQLSIFLRFAPQREVPQAQLSQYALNRHASLALADQLGLPEPTEEQLVAHIRTLAAFTNPATGQFDPKRYADFTDSLRTNPQMSESDVSRVIAADARIVAYEKLLAGPGYVTPADVAEMLARRDTTWTLAIASIDGSAFAPAIDTTDAAVQTWFDANARRYEISARVSVAAIDFPASAYSAGITISDTEVRAAYDANPAKYPVADALKDADTDAKFAAVRQTVEADVRQTKAETAALAAASDLAVELLEKSIKPSDVAAYLATKSGLSLAELGPVGEGSIPAALGGAAAASAILAETERLAADRPYSNPVTTPAGAALLVWRETIPARVPALAEVSAKALADYQAAEKRRLFNEAGRTLQASIASALAAPGAVKPFAELVSSTAPAGIKVEVKNPKPFSLSGQFPEDMDFTALQALQTLSKGKVSDFLPAGENRGVLVYALDQKLPEVDPASPAYAELRSQLAQNLSQANAQSLISAAVEAELAKTAPAVE